MSKLNETDTAENDLQKHPKAKEFIKQVWNIHHGGQPLPTDQNETIDSDIIIAQVCVRNCSFNPLKGYGNIFFYYFIWKNF
jgi:hypothetical protein